MFSATKGGSPSGYQISRSVRLRASASAYLNRTLTTPTSGSIWTYSLWVKRGALNSNQQLLSAGASVSDQIYFQGGGTDKLIVYLGASQTTTQVFRDPSAWYHFVFAVDTTQATASNRLKIYLNGSQITAFDATGYPTQNSTTKINSAVAHYIGRYAASASDYVDGYLTEINFIDGYPTGVTQGTWAAFWGTTCPLFGSTNATTGVWQPIKYTGTYGTNGFYLNFSDNSAATAAAIGADYSGNGNNFTPNNISVTAGVTYDSMLDVPTPWPDGGNGRGNYAVMNPLDGVLPTLTNGNLQVSIGAGTTSIDCGTMAVTSGKWYWEVSPSTISNNAMRIGVSDFDLPLSSRIASAAGGWAYVSNGNKANSGTSVAYGSAYTTSNIIGVALDMDTGTLEFFEDGVSQGIAYSTGLAGKLIGPSMGSGTGAGAQAAAFNFGQRPFSYTPPTGFKALNTLNLPTPTILKGNQYFDATLWTGDNTARNITNSGAMQPDLVWVKSRSTAGTSHVLIDAVRGANLALQSDLTNAEATFASSVTGFNTDGFALGTSNQVNLSPRTYVGWQWKEGATQGFDIVTWTGNGSAQAINHSLGVAPAMIIYKYRSAVSNWAVGHKLLNGGVSPWNYWLQLEATVAQAASSGAFNNTSPTSTQFTVGFFNQNATNMVAYLFAEVAGFSKFGSYTGNGSADGPFVFLGFRARFILLKSSSVTGSWLIYDTSRNTFNVTNLGLYPNTAAAQATETLNIIDVNANGFKVRGAGGSDPAINTNNQTVIYAAFAENPFKNALAR